MRNKKLLLVTSFVTGTVLMALEMVGSRMLAPYFGNSIYVWGSLIGIILLAISIGYLIGGKIADKYPDQKVLFFIILAASLYLLATLFFYRPLLGLLVEFGVIFGTISSSIVLFALPLLLLSFVPPFVVKLVAVERRVGSSVGTVGSISTIGNIFGVFFATFFMIPHIGTRLSLQFTFLTLLLICIIGLIQVNWRYIFLALLALLLAVTPAYSLEEGVIYEEESLYNHIIVKQENNEIRLYLNSDKFVQSSYNLEYYATGQYYIYFLIMPLIASPALPNSQGTEMNDLLILGMGGGSSIDQFQHYFPQIGIDAVEIDEKVVEVAKKFFKIKESDKVHIFVEDARPFLMRSEKKYDAIEIDIYHNTIYPPFYTLTEEFFQLVDQNLKQNGVVAMNVLNPYDSKVMTARIENTLLRVFPSVFEFRANTNTMIIALKEDLSLEELNNRLQKHADSGKLDPALKGIIGSIEIKQASRDDSFPIFTDDLAPVEELTWQLYKR